MGAIRFVVCAAAGVLFFIAGGDMHRLQSASGNTVAEFFDQAMGTFSYAMGVLSFGLGLTVSRPSSTAVAGVPMAAPPTSAAGSIADRRPSEQATGDSRPSVRIGSAAFNGASPAPGLQTGQFVRIEYKNRSKYRGTRGQIISLGPDSLVVRSEKSGKDVVVRFDNIADSEVVGTPD